MKRGLKVDVDNPFVILVASMLNEKRIESSSTPAG